MSRDTIRVMRKLIASAFIAVFLASASIADAQTVFPNRGGTGVTTTPSYGQVLVGNANGTYTLTATSALGISGGGVGGDFLGLSDWFATTTDALDEGLTNLYFTLTRWASALAGTTTDALQEGSTNRYYTDARVATYISGSSTIPHVAGSAYGSLLGWNGTSWVNFATSSLAIAFSDLVGSVNLSSQVSGTLPVARGGTGSTTLSGILKGNGTSQVQTAVPGTDYVAGVTGDWTGTFEGQEGSYYRDRANHTGTQAASTISDFNIAVGSYISGSSTVPHIGGAAFGDVLYWTGSGWNRTATSTLAIAFGDTTGTVDISSRTNLAVSTPITLTGDSVGCLAASGSQSGCLGSGDWTIFSNKVSTSSIDTEAELETVLTDVSNVFTDNDGALADDDLTNNSISDLSDVSAMTEAAGDLLTYSGGWTRLAIGTNGQVLAIVNGVPTWVASTTFSGGLTYAGGNVTANCLAITGSADLCDGDDATGGGGGASFGKSWEIASGALSPTTTLGIAVYASSTIGASTQQGGLTVLGGATTTGTLAVQGTATSTIFGPLRLGSGVGDNFFRVNCNGRVWPASATAGGCGILDNGTVNTGPALVLKTNVGSNSTGPLFQVTVPSTDFLHSGQTISYSGSGDGLTVTGASSTSNAISASNTGVDHTINSAYTGTAAAKGSGNFTSTNPNGSTLQITGVEDGFATLKVNQNSASSDPNSAVANFTQNDPTGQGIFLECGTTSGYSGKCINWRIDGAEKVTMNSSGNLGLSTTSPFAKLSVGGAAYVGGALTATGTVTFSALSDGCLNVTSGAVGSTGSPCGGGSGSPGGSDTEIQFNNGGAFGGEDMLTWNSTSDRLNVGTSTNPTGELYLYGEQAFQENDTYLYFTDSSGNNFDASLGLTDLDAFLFNANDNNLEFRTATGNMLFETESGDIDFIFSNQLTVSGADGIAFDSPDGGITVNIGDSTLTTANGTAGIATSTAWAKFAIEQGTETNSFIVANQGSTTPSLVVRGVNGDGKVGIATTSPEAKLDIWGSTGGKILTLFTNTGTKLMEVLNTGVVTLLGTWDFSNATVIEKVYPTFTYSTTTWSGTTTIPLGVAYVAETWNGVKCFTDTGTLNVSFYDGTNRMNLFNASTTVGTVTLSTNNAFIAGEKRYADVGTPATAPKFISCTVNKTVNQ